MSKKASKEVILTDVRCGFVFLANPNKDGKYALQPLLPRGSKQYKAAMGCLKSVFIEAFGEDEWARKGKYQLAIRDGDNDAVNGGDPKEGEEYRDHFFFNAKNNRKPAIRNKANQPASEEEIEELGRSGNWFHLKIAFVSHPPIDGGKPGVAAYVQSVMLRKAGEPLGGAMADNGSDFEEFAEADDDSDDFDDEL